MVWHGMVRFVSIGRKIIWVDSVLERLEAFRRPLNAFRALSERMKAFGRLGRLGKHSPIWYVCMVWYVCMDVCMVSILIKNNVLAQCRTAALSPI